MLLRMEGTTARSKEGARAESEVTEATMTDWTTSHTTTGCFWKGPELSAVPRQGTQTLTV